MNGDDAIRDSIDLLETIAKKKKLPLNKGLLDTRKVATLLINDYRNSLLGRISLESPESRDLMMKGHK
jgi:ribosome biogenesis GTPase A